MEDSEKKIEEKEIEKRKKKIINWFKNPYNLCLFGIIAVAFLIRIYYFGITKNQALWWDEACYTSIAKNLILHLWDRSPDLIHESIIRPILFPFFLSLLMRIGMNEIAIRFLFVLISSASVVFLYIAVKELYDRKNALVSSVIYAVLWIQLFYTDRIMVHIIAQALLFPSIYFFVKSIKNEKLDLKYLSISLFLLSIATLIRYTKGLIFFAFIIIFFIFLINKKFRLLMDYHLWISAAIGSSPLLIFFIINFITVGNIFPALFGGGYLRPVTDAPFFWVFFNYIPIYLESLLFIFFIIGISKSAFELIIGYDLIIKDRKLQNHLLLLLILLITCAFFVFYLKGGEDRYLFPASISIVAFASIGIVFVYDFLKKYNKYLALIILVGILFFGAYQELKVADDIIKNRELSYSQQKQGFEWIKYNTPKESVLLGSGIYPYAMYYAERKYIEIPNNIIVFNLTDFLNVEKNADYLIAHGFTPSPEYLSQYLVNQTSWEPIKVFYLDNQNTQPILIIYKKSV